MIVRTCMRPFASGFNRRLFTRCHFSEERAVDCAVEFLRSRGHSRIGYPHFAQPRWQAARGRLIKRAFQRRRAVHEFVAHTPVKDVAVAENDLIGYESLQLMHRMKMETFMVHVNRSLSRANSAENQAVLGPRGRTLASAAIALLPYLVDSEITALIAPNDYLAHAFFNIMLSAGLSIPKHMSLVSFDNYPKFQAWPISTIDFGFGYLGYCAYHAIMQDVKIQRDKYGNVAALPRVIQRGSDGPPRKRRLPTDTGKMNELLCMLAHAGIYKLRPVGMPGLSGRYAYGKRSHVGSSGTAGRRPPHDVECKTRRGDCSSR